jgi:predicted secreted Zn-dependent protease
MKRGLLVSVCLILITACNPAPEDVASPTAVGLVDIPNATIVYYDVAGSTENELRAQLDALGPVGYDGYKGDSTTQWIMRWSWPGYGSSSCDLSAAEVTYDIRVILPRWKSPENAGPDLVAKWTNYTRQLAEHEKGHVDFVVAHYPSIADAVKAAQCETAEVAAQAALARIRQHDVDYDAATHHGATQGARFP